MFKILASLLLAAALAAPANAQVGIRVGGAFGPRVGINAPAAYYGPRRGYYAYPYGQAYYPTYGYGGYSGYPAYGYPAYGYPAYRYGYYPRYGARVYAPGVGVRLGY